MSTIGWIERFTDSETGVDHLGMRVAGENLYAQLLDFTTTVSWRPRYFSFLCWALREAYTEASGSAGADSRIWNAALRRYDYAIAAASLLADRTAQRIVGSLRIADAVEGLTEDDEVEFVGDHVRASNASLAIYIGPMKQLGLLQSAGGVHRPSPAGIVLADKFEASLRRANASSLLRRARRLRVSQLGAIGIVCGISQLMSAASAFPEVAREREALRECIVDWAGFGATGIGPSASRILSIGLLLALHEKATSTVDLERFRAFLLHDSGDDGSLPETFDRVRAQWRIYQAHAFATFALEALLSVVLIRGDLLQLVYGDGVALDTLISDVVRCAHDGRATSAAADFAPWWTMPLDEVVAALSARLQAATLQVDEPELHRRVIERGRHDTKVTTADVTALLVLSLTRLDMLSKRDPEAWIGSRSSWRLPPDVLVDRLRTAMGLKLSVDAFLERSLRDLVIDQHVRNALRKLESDPSRYTAKFLLEGERVTIIGEHRPDMSTPRFDNSVRFLQDLGYLSERMPPQLTTDGVALLAQIRSGAPP